MTISSMLVGLPAIDIYELLTFSFFFYCYRNSFIIFIIIIQISCLQALIQRKWKSEFEIYYAVRSVYSAHDILVDVQYTVDSDRARLYLIV